MWRHDSDSHHAPEAMTVQEEPNKDKKKGGGREVPPLERRRQGDILKFLPLRERKTLIMTFSGWLNLLRTSFSILYFCFNKISVLSYLCLTLGRQEPDFSSGLSLLPDMPKSLWHLHHSGYNFIIANSEPDLNCQGMGIALGRLILTSQKIILQLGCWLIL